jgi:WD40 repeat protein
MFSRGLVRSAIATASCIAMKSRLARSMASYTHTSSVLSAQQVLSAKQITDSTIAVGDWDGKIYTAHPPATLEQGGPVRSIAKLNEDKFATADRSRVCVWDLKTHTELRKFGPEHAGTISDMCGFPNGLLAVVRWGSERVEIWDANTGTLKWALKGHTDDVKYMAGLTNNRLATFAWDHNIHIWNLETGQSEKKFHSGYIGAMVALPDDRLVTTNLAGITVWADGKCEKEIKMPDIPWHPRLAVTPDGQVLITAFKTAFRSVDMETGKTEDVYALLMPDHILCTDSGHVATFGPGREMNCFRPN